MDAATKMKNGHFAWKGLYRFTEPRINVEGLTVYPFDPSFPIDVSFQKASGSRLVRLNRHDFFEIIYMYSGKASIQVRDRILPAKPGYLVVIGPNVYHRLLHEPYPGLRVVSLNFHPEIVRSGRAAGEEEYYLSPFLAQKANFPHVIPSSQKSREIFELILKIHRELPAHTLLKRMAIRTYLKMILFMLFKHYSRCVGSLDMLDLERRNLERLQPAFELLEQGLAEPIKVEDAAHLCAMSCSHFMRLFKLTVGQTFRAYSTSFRIAKAQCLLTNKEIPIAEISQQMGFCSQSHFGKMFRALVGTTPRAYRQRSLA